MTQLMTWNATMASVVKAARDNKRYNEFLEKFAAAANTPTNEIRKEFDRLYPDARFIYTGQEIKFLRQQNKNSQAAAKIAMDRLHVGEHPHMTALRKSLKKG